MTNHTPIIETTEEYSDVLARHIACALRLVDKKEDEDLIVFFNTNHDTVLRLSTGWINCKGDSNESYARALCYGNLNIDYDMNHFNEIAELHYESLNLYYRSMATYVRKSLEGVL